MLCVKVLLISLLVSSCSCRTHDDQQLQVHLADLLTRLTQLVDKYEQKSGQMDRLELLVRCQPPSTLDNGAVHETVVDNKLVLKFSCGDHASLRGSEVLMCDRGVWNGSFPTCKSACQIPDEVADLVSKKTVKEDGHVSEAQFSCPRQSSLQGSEVLTCDSSGWSSAFPCCYTFKVGDQVRVKSSVTKPEFAWGEANSDSVGPITKVEMHKVYVHFPKQSSWMARPNEMELVPPAVCATTLTTK